MPEIPKGRSFKRGRTKVKFKQDGKPDKAATTPFYSENTSHHALYDTQAWRRLTKRVLRENPMCKLCAREGRATFASETDHIVAHKGNKALFFDRDNLTTYCKSCHARKSAAERNGKVFYTAEEWLKYLVK